MRANLTLAVGSTAAISDNALSKDCTPRKRYCENLGTISFHQTHKDRLLLEYMPNGSARRYLRDITPTTSIKQRLKWVLQATEALTYVDNENILCPLR